MRWYDGDVGSAIRTVREQSRLLLIFIKGSDDISIELESHFDEEISSVCSCAICLQMEATSQATAQFAAVYKLLATPCIYLISPAGNVLDAKSGAVSKSELLDWIKQWLQSENWPTADALSNYQSLSASNTEAKVNVVETHSTGIPSNDGPSNPASTEANHISDPTAPQSTDPVNSPVPLDQRVQGAYDRIQSRYEEKVLLEKQKEISDETKRRELGKSMQEFKERQKQREIKEAMAERRKEEQESRELRQRLLEQIAEDRQIRQERFTYNAGPSSTSPDSTTTSPKLPFNTIGADCDQTRLQFRFVGGGAFVGRFSPDNNLVDDVRNWLLQLTKNEGSSQLPSVDNMNESSRKVLIDLIASGYRFRKLHPSRLFTLEDEKQTLIQLDLCPSAALMLVPGSLEHKSMSVTLRDGQLNRLMQMVWLSVHYAYSMTGRALSGIYTIGSSLISSIWPGSRREPQQESDRSQSRTADGHSDRRPHSDRFKSSGAVRRQGNLARLSHNPDNSDDEQARWNGNSTEQL